LSIDFAAVQDIRRRYGLVSTGFHGALPAIAITQSLTSVPDNMNCSGETRGRHPSATLDPIGKLKRTTRLFGDEDSFTQLPGKENKQK
jgi:hypothetical protein